MTQDALLSVAQRWADQDPDPSTKSELQHLIDARDFQELVSRMGKPLKFGTAGLRGQLGAGSNRMNRVSVAQAAAGLAAYLNERKVAGETPSVVIGFDGRINSKVFARDSAQILAAAGIEAFLFADYTPTPVLAFATKSLEASAGIMVTASHNPPQDNGYKVYLGGPNGGSQITSPTDSQISAKIAEVAEHLTFEEISKSDDFKILDEELFRAYVIAALQAAGGPAKNTGLSKIAYTPMHGVGLQTIKNLFHAAGFPELIVVESQASPDGRFPTLAFPNPEEPGAMDEVFALARASNANLVIANDPDADRLAIGVPDPSSKAGWRRLTGDEIGLILGHHLAKEAFRLGRKGNLACSIVSSDALAWVAKKFNLGFQQTLTGFKWIAKVPDLIFGYEEALGYCIDLGNTPDKDGISSALLLAKIHADLLAEEKNLTQHLQELNEEYGYFLTGQISMRFQDVAQITNIMQQLRAEAPAEIAGQPVKLNDLRIGTEQLPSTDALKFDFDDRSRIIIRPSGTEPKLKCYLQTVAGEQKEAQEKLDKITQAMTAILT